MRILAFLAAFVLSASAWASGVPNRMPHAAFDGQGWLADCYGYAPTTGALIACPPGVRFRNHLDLVFIAPTASSWSPNPVFPVGTQAYNSPAGLDSTQWGNQNQIGGVWYTFPWSASAPIGVSCGQTQNIMITEYSGPNLFTQTDIGPSVNPIIQCLGGTWKDHLVYFTTLVPGGANGHPYAIYFSGVGSSGNAVGLSTADNIAGPWTDYGSNPILTGYYEVVATTGPPNNTRYLFTHASNTGSGKVYTIGSDGITLTQIGITLTAPTSHDWDFPAASDDFLQEMSVRYNRHGFWEMWYMEYDGGAGYNQAIGYAVSASPTGPWIRKPTGPTIWTNTRQFTSGTTSFPPGCPTVVESAAMFYLMFCSSSTFATLGANWLDMMVDY